MKTVLVFEDNVHVINRYQAVAKSLGIKLFITDKLETALDIIKEDTDKNIRFVVVDGYINSEIYYSLRLVKILKTDPERPDLVLIANSSDSFGNETLVKEGCMPRDDDVDKLDVLKWLIKLS